MTVEILVNIQITGLLDVQINGLRGLGNICKLADGLGVKKAELFDLIDNADETFTLTLPLFIIFDSKLEVKCFF